VYFVMELLEGQSLAALLRTGGPLPAARGLAIVRQLVNAVKAAHDASIVHRDLKPDNIHIGRGDGDKDLVKVVDFGLAKVIGSSKLTRAGMVFGTPHYMSPEQAAGEVVDHRADIYALGVVMYEMFTGKVPFEADSYMGVLTKHMYMAPAPPSSLWPEIKSLGALEDVILRCLQKRPEARYDNLAALLAHLDERLPQPARPAPGPSLLADELELASNPPAPAKSFRYWPPVVVGAAFTLGAALVLVLRSAGGSASPPDRSGAATPGPAETAPATTAPSASASPVSTVDAPPGPASASAIPARKPAAHVRVAPLRPSPAPAAKSPPSTKRGLGAGDIVDPWAH
jgi:eukaryotic-like serine/threonine-protein kinase